MRKSLLRSRKQLFTFYGKANVIKGLRTDGVLPHLEQDLASIEFSDNTLITETLDPGNGMVIAPLSAVERTCKCYWRVYFDLRIQGY